MKWLKRYWPLTADQSCHIIWKHRQMGGLAVGGNAFTVCHDNSLVLPTRRGEKDMLWKMMVIARHAPSLQMMWGRAWLCFCSIFGKEGLCQIKGSWAFLCILLYLTSIMITDVNYTAPGLPMNPSVVLTHCRFVFYRLTEHALRFFLHVFLSTLWWFYCGVTTCVYLLAAVNLR